MSAPSKMNDIFDSLLYFDRDKIIEGYENELKKFDAFCDAIFNGEPVPSNVFNMFDKEFVQNNIVSLLPNFKGDISIKPYLRDVLNNFFTPTFNKLLNSITEDRISSLQTTRLIACFSENVTFK